MVLAGLMMLLASAACGDTTVTGTGTGTGSPTVEPPTTESSGAAASIELTDDGFSPDRTEISQGTRLTLRNATKSKQSVVIQGRDFGGNDGNEFTLEAGQSLDLNVHQLGAYVLTLANDPLVTASIFIS